MQTYYIALHNSYTDVMIGVFNNATLIDYVSIDHKKSSSLIIPSLENLLQKNSLVLKNLSFIAVHQGPGPFTTLRVVITTANGLSFASHIPLIGVDGFDALIAEHQNPQATHTVALLNAFGSDLYVCIKQQESTLFKGVLSVDELIHELKTLQDAHILNHHTKATFWCIGNGIELCHNVLRAEFTDALVFPDVPISTASLNAIGTIAYEHYRNGQRGVAQLEPLYLKNTAPMS